jgi:hypothetical protein
LTVLYISPGAAPRAIVSLLLVPPVAPPRLAPAAAAVVQQGSSLPPAPARKEAVCGLVPQGGHGHGGAAGWPAAGEEEGRPESTTSLEKMEARPFLPIAFLAVAGWMDGWIEGMQWGDDGENRSMVPIELEHELKKVEEEEEEESERTGN